MKPELSQLQQRALVHAALGDPSRLAIVDALGLGDASPGEIARDLAMPTNLVAHHLRVLADAGLITRRRSEGDHRRTYLSLRAQTMKLLQAPTPLSARRVVFVCTHNSARSQIAAALWARQTQLPTASAGTQPAARVHPRAVSVARRHGLRLNARATAHIDDIEADGDVLVAVCDRAYEELPQGRVRLHWSVPDPATTDSDDAFEAAFADISARVDRLVPVTEPPGPPKRGTAKSRASR